MTEGGSSRGQPWAIIWQPPALREARRLDRPTRERILRTVDRFAAEGHGDVIRLTHPQLGADYRLRVGPWRVLFNRDVAAHALVILHVLPRGSAYED